MEKTKREYMITTLNNMSYYFNKVADMLKKNGRDNLTNREILAIENELKLNVKYLEHNLEMNR